MGIKKMDISGLKSSTFDAFCKSLFPSGKVTSDMFKDTIEAVNKCSNPNATGVVKPGGNLDIDFKAKPTPTPTQAQSETKSLSRKAKREQERFELKLSKKNLKENEKKISTVRTKKEALLRAKESARHSLVSEEDRDRIERLLYNAKM